MKKDEEIRKLKVRIAELEIINLKLLAALTYMKTREASSRWLH